MHNKSKAATHNFILFALLASSIIAAISYPQIGEVAGHLNFTVQVGHSQILQWGLVNFGDNSISAHILVPSHIYLTSNSLTANQLYPTYSISATNVTVPPHSTLYLNVTVFMPLKDTPNFATWEGVFNAQLVSNSSNPGEASVLAGVAKVFSIVAIPSTTTTSTTTSSTIQQSQASGSRVPYAVIGVVVVALIAVAAYMMAKGRKKPAKKAAPAKTRKPAAARKPRAKQSGRTRKKAGATSQHRLSRLEAENRRLRQQLARGRGRSRRRR